KDDASAFDVVLSDFRLPDKDGLLLYKEAKQLGIQCPYLLMTAYGDFQVAVEALKLGIADYLIKPVKSDALLQKVSSYLERRSLEEEVLFSRLDRKIVSQSKS